MNELPIIRDALKRIRGIADADGGRLLGEYGFTTIRDALFDANMAVDSLEELLASRGDDAQAKG